MENSKESVKFKISCDRNWKRMTRPRFADVLRETWEQMDDLDHDLDNALIIALPKGASYRQVLRALDEIEKENRKPVLPPEVTARVCMPSSMRRKGTRNGKL